MPKRPRAELDKELNNIVVTYAIEETTKTMKFTVTKNDEIIDFRSLTLQFLNFLDGLDRSPTLKALNLDFFRVKTHWEREKPYQMYIFYNNLLTVYDETKRYELIEALVKHFM